MVLISWGARTTTPDRLKRTLDGIAFRLPVGADDENALESVRMSLLEHRVRLLDRPSGRRPLLVSKALRIEESRRALGKHKGVGATSSWIEAGLENSRRGR